MFKFLLQPVRPFEFTSPVYDHLRYRFLWLKPFSSLIFAHPRLRSRLTRREINERLLEMPFILSSLPRTGKILDVGACESPLSLMLASSGYDVWAIDTSPYPFTHPHLKVITGDIALFTQPDYFDVVICLSVLEHIGIGVYGNPEQPGLDKLAVKKMWAALKPGGKLLLTTPVDHRSGRIPQSRIYALADLKKMFHLFSRVKIQLGIKDARQVWQLVNKLPPDFHSFGTTPCGVALISAIK